MKTYFDIIKLVFFLLTILITLFQLRIKGFYKSGFMDTIGPYILPVYFIFLGLIIGYIIGHIITLNHDNTQDDKDYILGFSVGILIGLVLAFIYYSMVNA